MPSIEVLRGIASVVSILNISGKMYGKYPKVTHNQVEYCDARERIVQAVKKIDDLKENPAVQNVPALLSALDAFSFDLQHVRKLSKVFKKRSGRTGRIKIISKQWWSSGDIRQELEWIARTMAGLHQQFSVGRIARIELQTHETTQSIPPQTQGVARGEQQNCENQTTLKAIKEKINALVISLEKDDKKAADAMGIANMTAGEMKMALKKSSMDLSRAGATEACARYLKLRIKALEKNLHTAEQGGVLICKPGSQIGDMTSNDACSDLARCDGFACATHLPNTGDPTQEIEDPILDIIQLTYLLQANSAATCPVNLARSLHSLNLAVGDLGWVDEATSVSQWAANLWRRLAQEEPLEFSLDYAGSLNRLSVNLALAGRHNEALSAAEESVHIYQRLFTSCPDSGPSHVTSTPTTFSLPLTGGEKPKEPSKNTERETQTSTENRPASLFPGLYKSLNSFSNCLADVGRHTEALAAIEEAVAIGRKLVEDQPATFLPHLSDSLHNLSNCLIDAGRHTEALTAIEEAAAIDRKLAEDRPAACLPNLSNSLNNLSLRLADAGRYTEALISIEEAVDIRRKLAKDRPAVFLPDLSVSLNNFSVYLADVGRHTEALEAILESVAISRKAAEDRPATFLPDLSVSLNNLSARLADAGRRTEALAAIEEAVAIRRKLAGDRPAAFLPDLSDSLNNLSNRLADVGRHTEAFKAIEEAVAIDRRLAEDRPAAFLPDLSTSLNNLSSSLADEGRHTEALMAIEESIAIRRKLAEDRPAAFLPNLSNSLNNLSSSLADAGRHTEALAAIEEAVTIRRKLAEDRPAVFLPHLSNSLNNLSNRLADAGRHIEALEAIEEAVAIRRKFAKDRPAAFFPDLSNALNSLSHRLADAGRHTEAFKAIEEAVAIGRKLVEDRPATFIPDLSKSLDNLSLRLADLGQHAEALKANEEAVAMRQGL